MLLPHGAVVAVVDGEKLELYRNIGNDAEMRRHYDKQLEAILVGEAHKDLVGRSGPDVLSALQLK